MFDLKMIFSQPWLLLLLIPAFALGLLPYFRTPKRYRRNRNRVTSTVLHLVVMTLSIFVLSGVCFTYKEYNNNNEIIFLVDKSFSTQDEERAATDYMSDVINMSNSDVYNIGVVTFGFDQKYAVPLTDDYSRIFSDYDGAEQPDTTATDIAAALEYTAGLFNHPESGKIILISDGVETDEAAASVIRGISAKGIRVDTVCTSSLFPQNEVGIVGTVFPDENIESGEEIDITLSLKSNGTSAKPVKVNVTYFDGKVEVGTVQADLITSVQEVKLKYKVEGTGLHPFRFSVTSENDSITENNSVTSYLYLETYDKLLIIESRPGISVKLEELFEDMKIETLCTQTDPFPETIDDLRKYDEVILNNIANADMTPEFVALLNEYVYDLGGGLFTVGGGEQDDPETAHAYNRSDMAGKPYQQMLPVQAIDYTPPLGLVIVIDVSGSMSGEKVEAAKESARSIVRDGSCLSERDYCAVITLNDEYKEEIPLISMAKQQDILDAIYELSTSGGTLFSPSIERASMDLLAAKNEGLIEKMHVIIITDGGVASSDKGYQDMVANNHQHGVSFSFVGIGATDSAMNELKAAAEAGGGKAILSTGDYSDLTQQLKDDVRAPSIKEVEYGEFVPTVDSESYYATVISQEEMPALEGFYGTKVRSGAQVALYGQYGVPIYASWKFGNGTVSSFMCDLSGVWSSDLLDDEKGRALVRAFVRKTFPTESIRQQGVDVIMTEQNYKTQLSLYPSKPLAEGESLRVNVKNVSNPDYQAVISNPIASENYSRASFIATEPGVYEITVERLTATGDVVEDATTVLRKSFSYSAEYDLPANTELGIENLQQIAELGNGKYELIAGAQPWLALEGFVEYFERAFNPALMLMIIAIVLFLLDIAVRKFKWKWLHEIIRDRKAKKAEKEQGGK